jgi:transcriptional regulator
VYLPAPFAETHIEELHRIIREHPLGMLVTHTASGLDANHIPFELAPGRGPLGSLRGHIARANPLRQEVSAGAPVLVVFRGAHGYVSPNWYPSKRETHRSVPTWNYEVVNVHGRIRLIDDVKFVGAVVACLTQVHEAAEPDPWRMADAPREYIEQMLSMVVGVEIEVTSLAGKRKLSQNRDARDFQGVVQALRERKQDELASAMERAGQPAPGSS